VWSWYAADGSDAEGNQSNIDWFAISVLRPWSFSAVQTLRAFGLSHVQNGLAVRMAPSFGASMFRGL